jgi:hypothetical protein
LRDDRREATIHVEPVIAVADRSVEGGQGVGLIVDPLRAESEPTFEGVEHLVITSAGTIGDVV